MKRRNPHSMSMADLFLREGRTPMEIVRASLCNGEPAPALCIHACRIDINGLCEHGCPSVLKALMIWAYGWEEAPKDGAD